MRLLIWHRLDANGQNDYVDYGYSQKCEGKSRTVRLLIDKGADVNAQDETHTTPLHLASYLGLPEIVQLLIECGVDVTSQNWTHRTPLHMASSSWVSTKPLFLSIERRAYINGQDDNTIIGMVDIPKICSKTETARLLIEHGADVTSQDENKSTPLHLASSAGNPEMVRLLIEHGADVTALDVHRMTPLHMASSWVSAEGVPLLKQ